MKSTDNMFWLIIHGHFYQPPRENPWIEAIEHQPGAAPYHDWNERIADECYTANTVSRILGPSRRIVDIVNNYRKISFNIGPTLLGWLADHVPETYEAIREADRQSVLDYSGHGNAIAQAYNHIILPLANRRDKITQIRWGLRDFEYRFQRPAKSIWLPETAVNMDTISVLIDHGIHYIILSPSQAQRIRSMEHAGRWHDVSHGQFDISQPYRCFEQTDGAKKNRDRYIDIFFYHGDLSKAIAFDHLLRDAKTMANRIMENYSTDSVNRCLSICTDGESYGHHEPFGDMGLAYLTHVLAPQKNIRITNYGEFLSLHPPTMEVELKPGPNNEGTSWSCFHGVGRWYRDCGCHTGGKSGWNQQWRQPLRNALDKLRDRLIDIFEDKGSAFFHDPWDARNHYIDVILDRSDASVADFFARVGKGSLTSREQSEALQLLEMQRYAMYMYTSCGWFFSDLAGIETIQILTYAARACELGNPFSTSDIENELLENLKLAVSNEPSLGTGKDIYHRFVTPSRVTWPQIVTHYAIQTTLSATHKTDTRIHHIRIHREEFTKYRYENHSLILGRISLSSQILRNLDKYAFALYFIPNQRYSCLVREVHSEQDFESLKSRTISAFQEHPSDFMNIIDPTWGSIRYSIKDMLRDDREQLYQTILHERLEQIRQQYLQIFEQNKRLLLELHDLDVPAPPELRIPAEIILSGQFASNVESGFNEEDNISNALEILNFAEKLNMNLNKEIPERIFQRTIEQKIVQFYESMNIDVCHELLKIHELADNLKLNIRESRVQNVIFRILREKLPPYMEQIGSQTASPGLYDLVNSILLLAYNFNFDVSAEKSQLRNLEQKFSDNPDYWP